MNESDSEATDRCTDSAIELTVSECVTAGREAMEQISDFNQAQADRLAQAVAWGVYEENNANLLVETTMNATEIGSSRHKREKLRDRTKAILMDVLGEPSVGEISCDRDGVVELAKPEPLISAIHPDNANCLSNSRSRAD